MPKQVLVCSAVVSTSPGTALTLLNCLALGAGGKRQWAVVGSCLPLLPAQSKCTGTGPTPPEVNALIGHLVRKTCSQGDTNLLRWLGP